MSALPSPLRRCTSLLLCVFAITTFSAAVLYDIVKTLLELTGWQGTMWAALWLIIYGVWLIMPRVLCLSKARWYYALNFVSHGNARCCSRGWFADGISSIASSSYSRGAVGPLALAFFCAAAAVTAVGLVPEEAALPSVIGIASGLVWVIAALVSCPHLKSFNSLQLFILMSLNPRCDTSAQLLYLSH